MNRNHAPILVASVTLLILAILTSYATAGVIYSSDVESTDTGWTIGNNATYGNDGFGGLLSPAVHAGSEHIVFNSVNEFAYYNAGVLIQAGTYTVSGWLGDFSNFTFPNPTFVLRDSATAELPTSQDAAAGGVFNLDAYITSSTKPAPTPGDWAQWTVVYEIPVGAPEIGNSLQFFAQQLTANANGTFDGTFSISFVPTPAALPAGLVLMGAIALRRRTA